jgi:hypothetical protein
MGIVDILQSKLFNLRAILQGMESLMTASRAGDGNVTVQVCVGYGTTAVRMNGQGRFSVLG